MATIKSLRFDLGSSWNDEGVRRATDDIDRLRRDIESLADKGIKIDVDDTVALAKVQEIQDKLRELHDTAIRLRVDGSEATAQLDRIQAQIKAMEDRKIHLTATADILEAERKLAELRTQEGLLKDVKIHIEANAAAAIAQFAALKREIKDVEDASRRQAAEQEAYKASLLGHWAQMRSMYQGLDAAEKNIAADTAKTRREIEQQAAALQKILPFTNIWATMANDLNKAASSSALFSGRIANIATAIIALAPAVTALGAGLLGFGATLVAMFSTATLALAPFAASMFGTISQVKQLNTTLDPLNQKLQLDQTIMQQNSAGAQSYAAAQKALASATGSSTSATQSNSVAHAQLGLQLAQQRQALAGMTRGTADYRAQQQAIAGTQVQLAQSTLNAAQAHNQNAGAIANARAQLQQYSQANSAYNSAAKNAAQTQAQINQTMQNATPVQRQLYTSLQGLEQAWQDFQTKAEQFTGPILAQGFVMLTGVINHMLPLVQSVAPIFQEIIDKAAKFTNSNGMTKFITWVIAIGVPTLHELVHFVGNLFVALGQMVEAFAPLGLRFATWLDNITQKLDRWGAGGGFSRFADSFTKEIPALRSILESLITLITNVIKAFAGLGGGGELTVIAAVLSTIAKLPVGAIQAIAVAFVTLKLALAGLGFVEGMINGITRAIAAWTAIQGAWDAVMGAAAIAATAFDVSLGVLVGIVALVVIGLIALGVGIYELVVHWNTVWHAIQQTAVTVWHWLEGNWGYVVAIFGPVGWLIAIGAHWRQVWSAIQTVAQNVWGFLKQAWTDVTHALQVAWSNFEGFFRARWDTLWNNAKTVALGVWAVLKSTWQATWTAIQGVATVVWTILRTLWQSTLAIMKGLWDVFSAVLRAAWQIFWTSLQTIAKAIWDFLRGNWSGFLNDMKHLWDTISGALKSAWDTTWNAIKTTATTIWDALKKGAKEVWDTIKKDFSTLVSDVKGIWNGIVKVFKDPVNIVIGLANKVLGFLGISPISPIATGGYINNGGVERRAAGGYIRGPGGPTQDKIPAMLSNGEFVMNAAAVQHYGLHNMHAMNQMRYSMGGLVQYYAGGGSPANPGGTGTINPNTGQPAQSGSNTPNNIGSPAFKKAMQQDPGTSLIGLAINALFAPFKAAVDAVINGIPHPMPPLGSPWGDIPWGGARKIADGTITWVENKLKSFLGAGGGGGGAPAGMAQPSGSLASWLQSAGIPQSQWGYYATLVGQESSGNAFAYNPSGASGIAQMMPGTFAAYGSGNIWNPVDNLRASWNYVQHTYGSAGNIPGLGSSGYQGYALGGLVTHPGMAWVGERGPELMQFSGGERITPFERLASAMKSGSLSKASGDVHVHMDKGSVTIHSSGQPGALSREFTQEAVPMLVGMIKSGVR